MPTRRRLVRWLWEVVREMTPEERSKLLFFCTGSAKLPATGFGELMGYGGQQQRFTVSRVHGADTGQLPTASTCFNKLHLCPGTRASRPCAPSCSRPSLGLRGLTRLPSPIEGRIEGQAYLEAT